MFAVAQTYQPGSDDFKYVFDVAVRLYPDSEVANLNAANALLEKGLAQQALPYLMKAGESPEAANSRGVAMRILERYDEAIKWLQQADNAGLKEAKPTCQELNKKVFREADQRDLNSNRIYSF